MPSHARLGALFVHIGWHPNTLGACSRALKNMLYIHRICGWELRKCTTRFAGWNGWGVGTTATATVVTMSMGALPHTTTPSRDRQLTLTELESEFSWPTKRVKSIPELKIPTFHFLDKLFSFFFCGREDSSENPILRQTTFRFLGSRN